MCPPGRIEYSFVCEYGATAGEEIQWEQRCARDQNLATYDCGPLPESTGGLQYAYAETVLVTQMENYEAIISRPLHSGGVSDGTEVVRDRMDKIKAAVEAKRIAAEEAAAAAEGGKKGKDKGKGKGKSGKEEEAPKKTEGSAPDQLEEVRIAATAKAEEERKRLILPGEVLAGRGRVVNCMDLKPRVHGKPIAIPPRTRGAAQGQFKAKMKKVTWTFPASLFAEYRQDTKSLMEDAFMADWGHCAVKKMWKPDQAADLEETRKYLHRHYQQIKDIYKHYAGSTTESFTMALNAFTDFVKECNIADDNSASCKWANIDMLFIGE
jgi:hypothetical protein